METNSSRLRKIASGAPIAAATLLVLIFLTSCAPEQDAPQVSGTAVAGQQKPASEIASNARRDYSDKPQLHAQVLEARELLNAYNGDRATLVEAGEILAAALEVDEQYVPAYIELARLVINGGHVVNWEFRGGTLEQAEQILSKAREIDEAYADTYVLLCHVYGLTGQYGLAMKNAKLARERHSTNPWLMNNEAFVFESTGVYDVADKKYQEVVDAGPGTTSRERAAYRHALSQQMGIAYQQSQGQRLQELAAQVVALAPADDAWPRGNAAAALIGEGYFDKGIEYVREALSIMDYGVGRFTLAQGLYGKWASLVRDGEHTEAQPLLEEAMAIDPDISAMADYIEGTGTIPRSLVPILRQKARQIADKQNIQGSF